MRFRYSTCQPTCRFPCFRPAGFCPWNSVLGRAERSRNGDECLVSHLFWPSNSTTSNYCRLSFAIELRLSAWDAPRSCPNVNAKTRWVICSKYIDNKLTCAMIASCSLFAWKAHNISSTRISKRWGRRCLSALDLWFLAYSANPRLALLTVFGACFFLDGLENFSFLFTLCLFRSTLLCRGFSFLRMSWRFACVNGHLDHGFDRIMKRTIRGTVGLTHQRPFFHLYLQLCKPAFLFGGSSPLSFLIATPFTLQRRSPSYGNALA